MRSPSGSDALHFCFQTSALRSRLPVPAAASASLAVAGAQLGELGVEPETRASSMELYLTEVLLRLEAGRSSGVPVRNALRAGLLQLLSQGMDAYDVGTIAPQHLPADREACLPDGHRADGADPVPSPTSSSSGGSVAGRHRCIGTSLAIRPSLPRCSTRASTTSTRTMTRVSSWYRSHFPSDTCKGTPRKAEERDARRRSPVRAVRTTLPSPCGARIADALPQ